jgi:hypothetical protein
MYKMPFLRVGKGTIVKWFAKRDFTVKLAVRSLKYLFLNTIDSEWITK